MKQAHAAELTKGTKLVFPAAGWQHTLMKKDFTPEGMIFGHNTLYFDHPGASALQKQFVKEYEDKYKDYPHWEADRAYFAMQVYKAGVEAAQKAKNAWPTQEDVINAMEGIKVTSLGGPGHMRRDDAIDLLRSGHRMARSGWNGKGMFLFYVKVWEHSSTLPETYPTLPFLAMKTADNKVVPWLASQTDMLATDWDIV
jgi:ABC-type branched-subunit amino acid transport system substrate-binding protein